MDKLTTNIVLPPGTILSGEYQIIRLIGQGGMGAVYMAYDTRLDLKVAIKVIFSGIVDNMETSDYDLALKRFQAEARIVARIDHPNVIRIFGFKHDTIENNGEKCRIDFLVMELMAERTLRDTMDDSGFEYEEEVRTWVTSYMIPILDGLEKVHDDGIIHRDIKPENIFMKENIPKLADFGLSMGHDFPSVTGSLVEIFGTLAYMAPEQYNNFSMARESADIFAVGRLLFEVIEGKITEKIIPFTQVKLSDTKTEYRKAINQIIMGATIESPIERIGSVRELRERLIAIDQSPVNTTQIQKEKKYSNWITYLLGGMLLVAILGFSTLGYEFIIKSRPIDRPQPQEKIEIQPKEGEEAVVGALPREQVQTIQSADTSVLHLVPSVTLNLMSENPFGENRISTQAFYLSESPITNEQYVDFLNLNLDKIELVDDDVWIDGQMILKLSEKIRGYKPIMFDGKIFYVKQPMHSSCAVLMVTGYGAEAYARYFGFRLMDAKEWFSLVAVNNSYEEERFLLPTPVINYPQKKFGLRGINQIAEWGRFAEDDFVILGQAVSNMIGNTLLLKKDPSKYYTDTSFRVAKNVILK